MKFFSALFYFFRKIYFSVFPRKVGKHGSEPATAPSLPTPTSLPVAPKSWTSPRIKWGMLGNDTYGDCVVAGILHAIMAVGAFLKVVASFTTAQADDAYFALTGGPDSGLDPPGVFEEWNSGTLPAPAQIFGEGGPFVQIDPTNIQQMKNAIATFGWVGIWVNLQQAQEDQFSNGQRWNYIPGSPTVGGHFVIFTGFDRFGVGPYTVSWAKGFRSTWSFATKLGVGACTGILPPVLVKGKYVLPVSSLKSYCAQLPAE